MARATRPETFEQRQQATTTWVVCEHAFIPTGTPRTAEDVIALIGDKCSAKHYVVTVNTRPINRRHVWQMWRDMAWAPLDDEGCFPEGKVLTRDHRSVVAPDCPANRVKDTLERVLERQAAGHE